MFQRSDNAQHDRLVTISDLGASTEYRVNSPAGEYGILYAAQTTLLCTSSTHHSINRWAQIIGDAGLIFYQAGIVVLTGSVFGSQLTTPLDGSPEFSQRWISTRH